MPANAIAGAKIGTKYRWNGISGDAKMLNKISASETPQQRAKNCDFTERIVVYAPQRIAPRSMIEG
jgi:hypothetical protein